jgi:group II intron reverse transcriptase/maturase
MDMGGGWVLEVDIQGFFDALDHSHLRAFLDQRVRDGVLRRMIDKWLKAGVLEDGQLKCPETGSPQGGVVSPILANLYLHVVLDRWFEVDVKPRLRGSAFLVRYADDLVIAFANEQDARRVHDVLAKRLAKYGLTLHPEKTRLVRFHRPNPASTGKGQDASGERPGTFDLLGFRHYWCRSRRAYWVIKQKTAPSRFTRALKRVAEWCQRNLHRPVGEQYHVLAAKLLGHCQYYGITGNSVALARFRHKMMRVWRFWLNRRSQRARMTWERFNAMLRQFPELPAKCVHSVYVR